MASLKALFNGYEAHQQALLDAFNPTECNKCHKPNNCLISVSQSQTDDWGALEVVSFVCMECINNQPLDEANNGN